MVVMTHDGTAVQPVWKLISHLEKAIMFTTQERTTVHVRCAVF